MKTIEELQAKINALESQIKEKEVSDNSSTPRTSSTKEL